MYGPMTLSPELVGKGQTAEKNAMKAGAGTSLTTKSSKLHWRNGPDGSSSLLRRISMRTAMLSELHRRHMTHADVPALHHVNSERDQKKVAW